MTSRENVARPMAMIVGGFVLAAVHTPAVSAPQPAREDALAAVKKAASFRVVVHGESIELEMEVEAVPEDSLVEILAPKGSDKTLDKRM